MTSVALREKIALARRLLKRQCRADIADARAKYEASTQAAMDARVEDRTEAAACRAEARAATASRKAEVTADIAATKSRAAVTKAARLAAINARTRAAVAAHNAEAAVCHAAKARAVAQAAAEVSRASRDAAARLAAKAGACRDTMAEEPQELVDLREERRQAEREVDELQAQVDIAEAMHDKTIRKKAVH